MAIAKVFMSGNSQAVRLPKEFRFDADEVSILRDGESIILRPINRTMRDVVDLIQQLPADMFDDIKDRRAPEDVDEF